MIVKMWINGRLIEDQIEGDMLLLDFLRLHGFYSVKRGCETANCGLCTVLLEDKPVLSCAVLAARADGKQVVTLEGMKQEAEEIGGYLADQGAEQCGFCNPGFIMNVIAMSRELQNPSELKIKEYLAGNLCRCTGYMGQLRAIQKYLEHKGGNALS